MSLLTRVQLSRSLFARMTDEADQGYSPIEAFRATQMSRERAQRDRTSPHQTGCPGKDVRRCLRAEAGRMGRWREHWKN